LLKPYQIAHNFKNEKSHNKKVMLKSILKSRTHKLMVIWFLIWVVSVVIVYFLISGSTQNLYLPILGVVITTVLAFLILGIAIIIAYKHKHRHKNKLNSANNKK
jgi:preprotein translocase subunit SecG